MSIRSRLKTWIATQELTASTAGKVTQVDGQNQPTSISALDVKVVAAAKANVAAVQAKANVVADPVKGVAAKAVQVEANVVAKAAQVEVNVVDKSTR